MLVWVLRPLDSLGIVCVPPRMASWGMDTYLYAPKDDEKHRNEWRELYSLEEAG